MSRNLTRKSVAISLFAAAVIVLAGCFGSKYTLIPPEQAKVDLVYVGDWDAVSTQGDHAALVIRNLNDKLYYVETRGKDENDAESYVGFIAEAKGATFAHLRALKEDGKFDDSWMLMRIALADNKLTLDPLADEFFRDKPISSPEQLRQILEQNLNNDSMYSQDERIVATRVVKK